MFVRELRWRWLVWSLALGLGPLALGVGAATPQKYVGDQMCSVCHTDKYDTYIQHGHPWVEVHTGGQEPGPDLFGFASVGVGLPTLPATMAWTDVMAILGNFKDGQGYLIRSSDGKRVDVKTGAASNYPANCFKCHNPTGYTPTGNVYGIPGWTNGSPALDPNKIPIQGVQCEHCHGPAATMTLPDKQICRDCHSSGDSKFRIPFNAADQIFANHHPEGDEYRRSPHKDIGCAACHDPHKSVWHDQGGVRFADNGIDMMCTGCHQQDNPSYPNASKVVIRGTMGEIGLQCLDCHMPEISGAGERASHLFKINPANLAAKNNIVVQNNDSGKPTQYWANADGNDVRQWQLVPYA